MHKLLVQALVHSVYLVNVVELHQEIECLPGQVDGQWHQKKVDHVQRLRTNVGIRGRHLKILHFSIYVHRYNYSYELGKICCRPLEMAWQNLPTHV
jgi:hypothetical protein